MDSLIINGPNVFVELPNGGEQLYGDTVYPIRWQTKDDITNVRVEYSINNGSNWMEVVPPNTGNTGSYNWLVPMVESDQCLVRVSDISDPCKFDTSNATFTIAILPAVTVLAPNGGEEFVVLLSMTDTQSAYQKAENIRQIVEHRCGVTISIGITEAENTKTVLNFIDRADKALYQAKTTGRNKEKNRHT